MNRPTLREVYVTKYALTRGILRFENVEHCVPTSTDMIRVTYSNGGYQHFHKPDWHLTPAAAYERAMEMRDRKIAKLKKRLEQLEKLTTFRIR